MVDSRLLSVAQPMKRALVLGAEDEDGGWVSLGGWRGIGVVACGRGGGVCVSRRGMGWGTVGGVAWLVDDGARSHHPLTDDAHCHGTNDTDAALIKAVLAGMHHRKFPTDGQSAGVLVRW